MPRFSICIMACLFGLLAPSVDALAAPNTSPAFGLNSDINWPGGKHNGFMISVDQKGNVAFSGTPKRRKMDSIAAQFKLTDAQRKKLVKMLRKRALSRSVTHGKRSEKYKGRFTLRMTIPAPPVSLGASGTSIEVYARTSKLNKIKASRAAFKIAWWTGKLASRHKASKKGKK